MDIIANTNNKANQPNNLDEISEQIENIELANNEINNFFNNGVWESNVTNIYNKKIANTIHQVQKLVKLLKPNNTFIMNELDFEIKDQVDILNQINKIKNENINYIKTHVDSIPEYHFLIISLKNFNF
jgi:hypothetical protein